MSDLIYRRILLLPPPLPPIYCIWLGLASVGDDAVRHASHSLSKTTREPSSSAGGTLTPHEGNNRRHPRGSYMVNPLLSLEVATPEHESID